MDSSRCNHFGRFDRRLPECLHCAHAAECRAVAANCYGTAYSREFCQVCELADYCRGAGDVHFHANRHGEPSITGTEEIESFGTAAPDHGAGSALGAVLDEFFAACRHDPVRIAAAVARHGGATLTEIGAMLGGYPKQWAYWLLSGIRNPALREYLLTKQTSKFTTSPLREEAKRVRVRKRKTFPRRKQMEFQFEEEAKRELYEQGRLFDDDDGV